MKTRAVSQNAAQLNETPPSDRKAAESGDDRGVISSRLLGRLLVTLAPRLSTSEMLAVRDALRGVLMSRVVVWISGASAVAVIGFDPLARRPGSVKAFGSLGNAIAAPLTGWDAASYVAIAQHGYESLFAKAFFPLYPWLIAVASWIVRSPWIAALGISLLSLIVALYFLHRLVALDLGPNYARPAVLLLAFSPMTVFLSAAYTESLFLSFSIGAVYAARRERWLLAGVLGALTAMTRNSGVLIVIPLVVLYLFGPRASKDLDTQRRPLSGPIELVWPRYRPDIRLLWPIFPIAGLGAVIFFMALNGDALAFVHAEQRIWQRNTTPFIGVWHGVPVMLESIRQLVTGASHLATTPHSQFSGAAAVARYNLVDWGFLIAAAVATIGVFRRLPMAYGLYSAALLVASTSAATRVEPLISLPRYVSVIFPLYMWLATWATERQKLNVVLVIFAGLAIVFSAEFATWRWVA